MANSMATLGILLQAHDNASGALKNVAKLAVGLGAAFAASAAVAVKAAAEEEVGMARLAQALKNVGRDEQWVTDNIEASIAMMEKSTAFSDGEMRDSLSLLIAMTDDVQDAQDRMRIAMDLARGTGMDLAGASKLLGKVTDENIGVLKRYGITVEKGATSTQLLDEVTRKFGGQAEAFAKTATGQWQIFNNTVANLVEDVGSGLLPVFTQLAGVATKALDWLKDSGGVDAFARAMKTTVEIVGELLGVLTGQAPDAGASLTKALGPETASTIMTAVATIREGVKSALGFIQTNVIPLLTKAMDFLKENWDSAAFAMKVVAATVLVPAFVAWAAAAATAAAATIVAMAPVLLAVGAVALAAFALHEAWEHNFLGIRDAAQAAGDFLGPILAGIGEFLSDVGEKAEEMAPMFLGAFEFIKGSIGATIAFITAPIRGLIDLVQRAIGFLQTLGIMQASVSMPSFDQAQRAGERGGVIAAQHGFEGIVTRPTLFMAGEAGAEYVRVTPGGGSRGGGGGLTINVNINGDVYDAFRFEDRVRRAVADGVRRGGFRGLLAFAPAR